MEKEKINNFINDLERLMLKYNLSISHEDGQGRFIIERFDQFSLDKIKGARINNYNYPIYRFLKEPNSAEYYALINDDKYIRVSIGDGYPNRYDLQVGGFAKCSDQIIRITSPLSVDTFSAKFFELLSFVDNEYKSFEKLIY